MTTSAEHLDSLAAEAAAKALDEWHAAFDRREYVRRRLTHDMRQRARTSGRRPFTDWEINATLDQHLSSDPKYTGHIGDHRLFLEQATGYAAAAAALRSIGGTGHDHHHGAARDT